MKGQLLTQWPLERPLNGCRHQQWGYSAIYRRANYLLEEPRWIFESDKTCCNLSGKSSVDPEGCWAHECTHYQGIITGACGITPRNVFLYAWYILTPSIIHLYCRFPNMSLILFKLNDNLFSLLYRYCLQKLLKRPTNKIFVSANVKKSIVFHMSLIYIINNSEPNKAPGVCLYALHIGHFNNNNTTDNNNKQLVLSRISNPTLHKNMKSLNLLTWVLWSICHCVVSHLLFCELQLLIVAVVFEVLLKMMLSHRLRSLIL